MKTSLIAATALVIILLAGAGAYFVFWNKPQSQTAVAPVVSGESQPQATSTAPAASTTATAATSSVAWEFKDAGTDQEAQAPLTTVSIRNSDGTVRTVGTYQGSCATIDGSSWQLVQGESSGVICWWAGGGTEIGAFKESGKLVIKEGGIEEATEESDGFRGGFKALFSL